MNKLMLDPETLRVESFETARANDAVRGTVRAHGWTQFDPTCGGLSCDVACRTRYGNTCVTGCLA
jgi:hypothetical protein